MVHRCCIQTCNRIGLGHRFPQDPIRKAEWLKVMSMEGWMPSPSSQVCKIHFVPENYFCHSAKYRDRLKKNAVPSQFLRPVTSSHNTLKPEIAQQRIRVHKRSYLFPKSSILKRNKSTMVEEDTSLDFSNSNEKLVNDSEISFNSEAPIEHPEYIIPTLNEVVDHGEHKEKDGDKREKNVDQMIECRACLLWTRMDRTFSLFQAWAPTWEGLGPTIAEDFSNFSNIQLSETDVHSKFICYTCCEKLWNACSFKTLVQDNDRILRQRISNDTDREWPKPIQVDKNINVFENDFPFNVHIKQEVLSDDEACNMEEGYTDTHVMEIKVEPEEIIEQPTIIVNGVTSLKEFPTDEMDESYSKVIKEEPKSDVEESEVPLECLLCMRPFNSTSGLKAHVIAQHSYQMVGRGDKANGDKHVCGTCRRTFTTSTDLMVHETCHNKHVCYGCNKKFDTFAKLSHHRKRCKALDSSQVKRPKMLDDVIRPQVEDSLLEERDISVTNDVAIHPETKSYKKFSCPLCNEIFTDKCYVKIHQELHHSNETDANMQDACAIEVETLENIFFEDT